MATYIITAAIIRLMILAVYKSRKNHKKGGCGCGCEGCGSHEACSSEKTQ